MSKYSQYSESAPAPVDPYSDAYNAPPPSSAAAPLLDPRNRDPLPRGRSRSRSPIRGVRSPPPSSFRRRSPPPTRPKHAPQSPNPTNVLGVFGLSIRTTERDLDDEFSRFGRVEKVTIVYDQRSDRSRGFGFIKLATVEDATRCIQELNGVDLNGRHIRVDYSVTDRPHAATPGEYMGHRRTATRDRDRREPYRDAYRDRDRDYRRDYDDRGRVDRYAERERDRDPYGRDSRDWRRRSPPPPPPPRRYSPDRRRRSYSRSPPRGAGSSPVRGGMRDYDVPPPPSSGADHPRW
ncbi:RNA-binding domain-containing protein [Phellopilus nigrolimitatus]|nr:RNA-binding domain-containing protein [Phellopilus nigrolimitatus]